MVDPYNVTKFDRSREELEEFALFATLVAGKPAHRMAKLLDKMLLDARFALEFDLSPFEVVRTWVRMGTLEKQLRHYGTGQYERLVRCWTELTKLKANPHRIGPALLPDVDLGSASDLRRVHGIGPKTSNFIVLHSQRNARCIPIDTHWVKELVERGYITPQVVIGEDGKVERHVRVHNGNHSIFESYALKVVEEFGRPAAEVDLMIWKKWNLATQRRAA